MPKVGEKEFPYTPEGIQAAAEESSESGMPIQNAGERSTTTYAGGGKTGYSAIGAERPMYKEGGKVKDKPSKKELKNLKETLDMPGRHGPSVPGGVSTKLHEDQLKALKREDKLIYKSKKKGLSSEEHKKKVDKDLRMKLIKKKIKRLSDSPKGDELSRKYKKGAKKRAKGSKK